MNPSTSLTTTLYKGIYPTLFDRYDTILQENNENVDLMQLDADGHIVTTNDFKDVTTSTLESTKITVLDDVTSAGSKDIGSVQITRKTNYTDGPVGFSNSGIHVETYVNATTPSYERGITSVMHNYSASGQAAGIYGIVMKHATTSGASAGSTIGAQLNAIDLSGTVNPTTDMTACQVYLGANGQDTNQKRVALDVIHNNITNNGTKTDQCYCAVRVQNNNSDAVCAKALYVDTGCDVGLDLGDATIYTSAITIPDGSRLHFDQNHTHFLQHVTSGADSGLLYNDKVALGDDGNLTLNGVDSSNLHHFVKYTPTFKTGMNSSTLGSNRPGSYGSGAPDKWMQIIIDGNLYCFPVWAMQTGVPSALY
jgi:hypothetical protein